MFSSMNKQFLIFVFFLVLSGIFWLMMTLNETYEKDFAVAVRLVGEPKNTVITTPMSDTIRVTIRDKGFMLLGYATSHKLRPINLDFNTYANSETGHGTVPVADLQKAIRLQLFSSSTISSIKADRFDFYFNYGLKKTVKVSLDGSIVPAKDYYLAHVQFWPDKVTVYASRHKLDSIATIPTTYMRVVNFSDTVVKYVTLKAIDGVKIVPSRVKMVLYPDILTEATAEVPITAINRPPGLVIRTFPQRVKVTFSVGASMYRQVKLNDFRVVVDYKDVAAHPSDKCNLYVTGKPRGVGNVQLEMNQVDYLIEQQ